MPDWRRLDDGLLAGAITWFGETHGTEQSPRFVGDVAEYAAATIEVQLALELPRDAQAQLDSYVRRTAGASSRSISDRTTR